MGDENQGDLTFRTRARGFRLGFPRRGSRITYVFPAGGQRGTTIKTMARGRGLEGASEVRISGQGVTAKVLAIEEPSSKLQQRSANRQDTSENPNVVRISVTAPKDAPLGLFRPRIVGTAQIHQQPVVREALPSEDMMQAFIYWHSVPSKEFALSVVPSAAYSLSAEVPSGPVLEAGVLEVTQGGKVQVVVKAARQEGATGAIRLAADTPPRGITVKAATIAADKDEATVTLTVTTQAPVGFRDNIILTGTLKVGKENVTRIAPAITIRVVDPKTASTSGEF